MSDENAFGNINENSIENKRRYCELNDYELVVHTDTNSYGRPKAWSKLLAIKKYLKHYDYVFYMDLDTVIMNPHIKVCCNCCNFDSWSG